MSEEYSIMVLLNSASGAYRIRGRYRGWYSPTPQNVESVYYRILSNLTWPS